MIKCLNKAEDRSNAARTYLYMQFIIFRMCLVLLFYVLLLKKTKVESKGAAFFQQLSQKLIFHSPILKTSWEVLLPAVGSIFWYRFKIR
jgi:hypothetical protein